MALFFQRDATLQVYPNKSDGTFPSASKAFAIPMLEGFSFSQSTNSSEITLSEMESTAGTSRRGRKMFNDSLAPVEWSFSTYIRPYIASSTAVSGSTISWADQQVHLVDECLWNSLLSKSRIDEDGTSGTSVANLTFSGGSGNVVGDVLTATNGTLVTGYSHAQATVVSVSSGVITEVEITRPGQYSANPSTFTSSRGGATVGTITVVMGEEGDSMIDRGTTKTVMSSKNSNVSALNTMTLEFMIGTGVGYKLNKAVCNSATINFDVEGIATIEWSGMAATIDNITAFTAATGANSANAAINEGGTSADTENFIRNRLTAMSVAPKTSGTSAGVSGMQSSYDLTLTGGSITIENNISYLTPEELGVVNKPIEHVTGVRNVGGSFTCYLASNSANNGSKDFFEDLTSAAALDVITHDFEMIFKIGGSSGTPRIEVKMPQCHVEVPTHSIEDVISLESTFTSLQSDMESNIVDDLELSIHGVALS